VTVEKLLQKADQAVASAKVLLDTADTEGACNRAYYGMFDAAKASLALVGAPQEVVDSKSHSGVLQAFGLYVVKAGRMPAEFGRSLRRVEEMRGAADYSTKDIPDEKAQWAVDEAVAFVAAVKGLKQS
jgi:uncharacterized protein (UPF0332 family)